MFGEIGPKLRSFVTNLNPFYGYLSKIFPVTGTAYTLELDKVGQVIEARSGSATTFTLSNYIPEGACWLIVQKGAGQITLTAGSGATLRNSSSYTKTRAQYSVMSLYVSTNPNGVSAEYVLAGDGAT